MGLDDRRLSSEIAVVLPRSTVSMVREQVIRLAVGYAHDDDARVEECLDRLGDMLAITSADAEAEAARYHRETAPEALERPRTPD